MLELNVNIIIVSGGGRWDQSGRGRGRGRGRRIGSGRGRGRRQGCTWRGQEPHLPRLVHAHNKHFVHYSVHSRTICTYFVDKNSPIVKIDLYEQKWQLIFIMYIWTNQFLINWTDSICNKINGGTILSSIYVKSWEERKSGFINNIINIEILVLVNIRLNIKTRIYSMYLQYNNSGYTL